MQKIILIAAMAAFASTPALAINRYNSMSYTCSAAQALINRERAVIMRYPAPRTKNMTLYDRYVDDSRSCDIGYYAYQDYLPTKDMKSCPVYTCRSSSDLDDDDIFIPGR
jgi:hypothetical protein